jgi:oligoendopeptidase F
MWLCKSHYYSSGLSFYNFPYAFGNLFAQGLYALYQKEGTAFVANYKEMLRTTSIHSIEEDGAQLGIDLTKKEFWKASLQMIADEIEEFCAL